MKRLLSFCLIMISYFVNATGQTTPDSNYLNPAVAAPGTYQFIYHPCKIRQLFTRETLIQVEQNRENERDKTLVLDPCTEVFIPSRKKISSTGFIPLTETIEAD